MTELTCNRTWAMPNKNTFKIKPLYTQIEQVVSKYGIGSQVTVVDPFANAHEVLSELSEKYGFTLMTNDLNPEFDTSFHLDALEFLKCVPDNSADIIMYDPPFSLRQVSESYKHFGREVTMETTQASWRAKHLDEIQRIIRPNGTACCFGWNSNGVGKKRDFKLTNIEMVAHGGSHNDTIMTTESYLGN